MKVFQSFSLFVVLLLIDFFGVYAQEYQVIENKKDNYYCVEYSKDGKYVAAGTDDGRIQIIDVETRAIKHTLQGAHYDMVLAAAFSPNGMNLATGCRDNSLVIWNINSGILQSNFIGAVASITSVVYSTDGMTLYAGSVDGIIHVYDLKVNQKIAELRGHESAVTGLAINEIGTMLASSSYDKNLVLWDLHSRQQKWKLNVKEEIRSVAFNHKGDKVAIGLEDKSVRELEVNTQKSALFLRGHRDVVYDLEYTKDGKYLISGGLDNNIFVWDAETGEQVKKFNTIKREFVSLSMSPLGDYLAIADMSGVLRFWNLKDLGIEPKKFRPMIIEGTQAAKEVAAISGVDYKLVKTKSPENKIAPKMEIVQPKVPAGKKYLMWLEKEITVKGSLESDNGIFELTVNDLEIPMDDNWNFEHSVKLAYGKNTLKFKAVDKYGNITEDSVVVLREVKIVEYNDTLGRMGTDYALVICTNEYDSWSNLSNPIPDGEAVASALKDKYGFKTEILRNPSKKELYSILRAYSRKQYADDDQLFIFIAGHGLYDDVFQEGYIATKESDMKDEERISYITHSNLRTIINNISCNHILLSMDVCFGGYFGMRGASSVEADYDRAKFIQTKMEPKTRKYITSGGNEYVPDGRPGHHSPYCQKLLDAFDSNGGDDKVLTFIELFSFLQRIEGAPSPTQGKFGSDQNNSDFLFIAK